MTRRGLAPELMPAMETSIALFNSRLQKKVSEQNFYDTLLNRIDFGLIVVDIQGVVSWINKMALDMLGRPQPKTLADLENTSQGLSETLSNLRLNETRIIQINKGGKEHRIAATAVYFITKGKYFKIISLKHIQTVLDETESDAWKKLIRVLMHEIMNSLTPIISLSETFARPDDDNREMIGSAMQAIHRRSSGLVDFINNYRQLTHIPVPVIAPFAAQEWLADLHRLLAADNYSFTYTVTPADMTILADRTLMDQVMINIIKNACESSALKHPSVVSVSISKNDYQRPLIKVTDNGNGILPEVMPQIFVPFFTTKAKGSGIGLSICRQIITHHGGLIAVESEPERGSCFTITL
jgi:nitrogen fixation/metabolism regulation signal transduction histidine kinase